MDWILIQCRWTNLTAIARGSPPPARDSMGMAAAGGRLFVFGGQGPEGHRAADSCGLGLGAHLRGVCCVGVCMRMRSTVLASFRTPALPLLVSVGVWRVEVFQPAGLPSWMCHSVWLCSVTLHPSPIPFTARRKIDSGQCFSFHSLSHPFIPSLPDAHYRCHLFYPIWARLLQRYLSGLGML